MCLPRKSTGAVSVLIAIAVAGGIAFSPAPGAAQGGVKLPKTVEPGRRARPSPAAPAAPLQLQWVIELPPGPTVPKRMANQAFRLKGLSVQGVTVYGQNEIRRLFSHLLNKTITFGAFYGIAQAIQALYHRDGYILSFAYVPPQKVADGVFQIVVVEGFVKRVTVEGVKGRLKRRLEKMFAPIAARRPLNTKIMERYLLLGNDLAGVRAKGVLQPSRKTRGASDLIVKVERKPFSAQAEIDNRGSQFVGPWRTGVTASANSVLGRGERVTASFRTAGPFSELISTSLDAAYPIGLEGLTVGAAAGYITAKPGSTLAAFDTGTRSVTGDLKASYPLIRSRAMTLRTRGSLSFLNAAVDIGGSRSTSDRIRTINAGITFSQSGFLRGGTGLGVEMVQAVPFLDSSDAAEMSRKDADTAFTKLTADFARTQILWGGLLLGLNATAQLTRSPLPASAEFAVGGPRFGRGYDSAEITGEDGFAVSAELRYPWDTSWSFLPRLTPYLFYDFGKVWNEASASSVGASESLASTGLGLRGRLPLGATLDFEYARPLTRVPSDDPNKTGRLFLFIRIRF